MALSMADYISRTLTGGPSAGAYALEASSALEITDISVGDPAMVSAENHYKKTGDRVTISGNDRTTPDVNGSHTITVVDDDNFTLDGFETTNDAGSGSYGQIDNSGRITALTGGNLVASAPGNVAGDDDHPAMADLAARLERAWKVQQLGIANQSQDIIVKSSLRVPNGEYEGGGKKYALKIDYRVSIYLDEDDFNDTVVSNVFDFFNSD